MLTPQSLPALHSAYQVTISNESNAVVILQHRHWIINDSAGSQSADFVFSVSVS